MARYQVIVAYDGTLYQGFQRQANAPTVQEAIEHALRQLNWQDRSILAAGRTDAGVHASGQVVAFDLDWKHSEDKLRNALNALLPPDLAVKAVHQVAGGFHPRYDAISRCYSYRLFFSQTRDPLRERYAWRVWPAADFNRMSVATVQLVGTHDFATFGTPPRSGSSTVRTVFSAEWRELGCIGSDGGLLFEINANAFLYHMVRRMVFILVAIGQGKQDMDAVRNLLESRSLYPVQGLAPSHGLTLVEVTYP